MARLLRGAVRCGGMAYRARMGRGEVWGAAVRVVCMSFSHPYPSGGSADGRREWLVVWAGGGVGRSSRSGPLAVWGCQGQE